MFEPREADLPTIFLVLVVLPSIVYILLGKWSCFCQRKANVSELVHLEDEEPSDEISTGSVVLIPSAVSTPQKPLSHQCARCSAPARTRCSRCKSVRYCSGHCQIIHWRQCHKLECQKKDAQITCPFVDAAIITETVQRGYFMNDVQRLPPDACLNISPNPDYAVKSLSHIAEKSKFVKLNAKSSKNPGNYESTSDVVGRSIPGHILDIYQSDAAPLRWSGCLISSNEDLHKQKEGSHSISARGPPYKLQNSIKYTPEASGGLGESIGDKFISLRKNVPKFNENQVTAVSRSSMVVKEEGLVKEGKIIFDKLDAKSNCPFHTMERDASLRGSKEDPCQPPVTNVDISEVPDSKAVSTKKLPRVSGMNNITSNTSLKVLFPYEDFVHLFSAEVWDLYPRGLQNCGNSCYANAVLQCLTSTKPINIYLLRKSHSKNCQMREWCLMCELERHVSMLGEGGGPLSIHEILLHIPTFGYRMGTGSQEDAHEFLRLLVALMQSICLNEKVDENVDSKTQETTFIYHTFGGFLRSKVHCLRCQHNSERYDNIMDLTLEILGCVESLEDALAQFTSPEELDGENMYECGRCGTYAKARKQLRIHEAPNVLTVVLKRFKTGKYGKINKCISYPELLDLTPFMTRTCNRPPLYFLYGVVVHLDALNASFSGHYVSYVKDSHGIWLRIDDTQVESVPLSQVMSEAAYILFYSRFLPRPCPIPTGIYCNNKNTTSLCCHDAKNFSSETGRSRSQSRHGDNFSSFSNCQCYDVIKKDFNSSRRHKMQYCDQFETTASDRSVFTSSDESSYTSESTCDSLSTGDNDDPCSMVSLSLFRHTWHNKTLQCHW